MIITKTWLEKNAAGMAGKSWTRSQLQLLGVSWPPKKGWKSGMVGAVIHDDDARQFELIGQIQRNKERPS